MTQPNPQAANWNTTSGNAWVDMRDVLEEMFRPLETLLVAAIPARPGLRVLDIGCGTGATTLAAARKLGADGAATGIDISVPMLATARDRAAREGIAADFLLADAQAHDFGPARFDFLMSRFGVMFFSDPVAAFTNLRRAASEGADMNLIVWRAAADNPFMTVAERAAAPLLPGLPPRDPDAPGQFAFADPGKVRAILSASGWTGIDIAPLDAVCAMPEAELIRYFSQLGPVGNFLQQADPATREKVVAAVRPAFDPFIEGDTVRFTAACWTVTARA